MPDANLSSGLFWWNWWVKVAAAFATFMAVLIALFGPFRTKFFPPKLTLRVLNLEGEMTTARWQENGQIKEAPCRYYHIRVSNTRRWSPASQVQLLLLQVEEPAPNGDLQIKWTGAIPLGWRHQQLYPVSRTIGAPADADLCSVRKGNGLQIHPLVIPHNLVVQRPQESTFVLVLQAQATEADSEVMRVKITWDGGWHDGVHEMHQHLIIEALRYEAPRSSPE